MIDIDKAKKVFDQYVSNYNMEDEKIALKYDHTLRVADLCKKIAVSLNLSEEKVLLAELIGLLHDVGRFDQIKLYNSFNDKKTIDHAKLGVSILFDNNFIRDFISTDEYDEVIKTAIFVHNKLAVEDNLSEEEKLYAKIVRDADKIDILYLIVIDEISFDIKDETLNETIANFISNEASVDRKYVNSAIDKLALNLAFVYDLNFLYSFEILKQKNYIPTIIDSLNIEEKDKNVLNKIKDFVNEKTYDKGVK